MTVDEIDDVVLVGGSSRIPWVRTWLTEYFGGMPPNDTLNADECVAYGATIIAEMLAPAVADEPALP